MKNIKKTYCEVCQNDNPDNFRLLYLKEAYEIFKCNECGFVFIPQFHRIEIPYSDYRDEEVLAEVRRGNNMIKIKRHKLRVNLIKKYLKTGKLFDIGSGWGHFLYTAKLCGFETEGIEISKLMCEYAKEDLNLDVTNVNLFEDQLKVNYYDIATMWDVLEHLDYPAKALEIANKVLKPRAYLVLQVPQIDSFIAKRQKSNWSMFSLEHLNYFSSKTIKLLLEDKGFELIKIKSSFEFKLFIMFRLLAIVKRLKKRKKLLKSENISNTERQLFFNKLVKMPKFLLIVVIFMHDLIYNLLSFLRIGDEMIVIARKNHS